MCLYLFDDSLSSQRHSSERRTVTSDQCSPPGRVDTLCVLDDGCVARSGPKRGNLTKDDV